MSSTEPAIQFFYRLHGGESILFAAGSGADVRRLGDEAVIINEATGHSTDTMSPGTRHFFTELGRIGGVEDSTEAVLEHYDGLVKDSRVAFLKRIRDLGES